ncbi:asparaginase domain-containing protein [Cellulomonas marina]|uniref:L-asparaginase n=1 Tax=Cellulomonas marina TaxID=988821 RepID=A0A1I0Z383_9CELL|nr:asparaginase domain-containing protein [Cellulomonas marina]GIG28142.1 L-asparaginase [Cellulomonas marina]SFB18898.1 L-asparaginase [Cellulomonas marina]
MSARVLLLTLGGTIGSSRPAGGAPDAGIVPTSGAALLARELEPWLAGVTLVPHELRLAPSPSLLLDDVLAVARAVRAAAEDATDGGFAGVVVSQGTDTLEETAFVLDVLGAARDLPVVVTGAMRDREAPGTDGPANLVAAVDVAASPAARGHGVLVAFADAVHAGRHVRKESSTHTSAFTSAPWGPVGHVHERVPHLPLVAQPVPRLAAADALLAAPPGGWPAVALVGTGLGDDLRLLPHLAALGYAGVVVEGMGGGHVAAVAMEHVRGALAHGPVAVCSRAGVGPTLRRTYGYPGGEIDLLGAGALWGGLLTGAKARLLLALCLRAGLSGDALRTAFEALAAA